MKKSSKIVLSILILATPGIKAMIPMAPSTMPRSIILKESIRSTTSWANQKFTNASPLIAMGAGLATLGLQAHMKQGFRPNGLNENAILTSCVAAPLLTSIALMKTSDKYIANYGIRSILGAAATLTAGNFLLNPISPEYNDYLSFCIAIGGGCSLYYFSRNFQNWINTDEPDSSTRKTLDPWDLLTIPLGLAALGYSISCPSTSVTHVVESPHTWGINLAIREQE